MKTVLFLCTGNSCRSIMAEAILNDLGRGRYVALSAGSRHTGEVNPFSLSTLSGHQHPIDNLYSKSWDDIKDRKIDTVITVCNAAAGEVCPVFPGKPAKLHWDIPDPGLFDGSQIMKTHEFERVYQIIRRQVETFLSHETT